MSNLSQSDIANLWTQLGGDPATAVVASAVAMAESEGNPNAINPNDPNGGSFGLFQINAVNGIFTKLEDNVKKAISLSNNGTNWNQWGSFTDGRYRKYLQPTSDTAKTNPSFLDALKDLGKMFAANPNATASIITTPEQDTAQKVTHPVTDIVSNLSRGVAVVLGLICIAVGLMMFRPVSETVITTAKTAAKVAA